MLSGAEKVHRKANQNSFGDWSKDHVFSSVFQASKNRADGILQVS
jgi:hypothetical protein